MMKHFLFQNIIPTEATPSILVLSVDAVVLKEGMRKYSHRARATLITLINKKEEYLLSIVSC